MIMADTMNSTPHALKKTIIHVEKISGNLPRALRSGKQYGENAGCQLKNEINTSQSL